MERINALEKRVSDLERQLREFGYPSARIPGRLMKPKPKLHVNWTEPYLLDTQSKVDWANANIADGYVPWKLGDHCPFEPPKELSDALA
jgi:hypothetical protein